MRASKKSVTAMSASKVSNAASTTNPGYDSENFALTQSNATMERRPDGQLIHGRDMYPGGY